VLRIILEERSLYPRQYPLFVKASAGKVGKAAGEATDKNRAMARDGFQN
jgi:hypothetical protein